MGLSYKDMYSISKGIWITFNKNKPKKKLLTAKLDKHYENIEHQFPINNYSDWTKENFIVACLYIAFKHSPKSYQGFLGYLETLDLQDVINFKNEIIYYKKFLDEDLERIFRENTLINIDLFIEEYKNKHIKWYTYYFYLYATNNLNNERVNTRLNNMLLDKIKKLLLYVSFSEKSIIKVKEKIDSIINI